MSCGDDLFCGINKAKSAGTADMTDLDKKHTPVIKAPSEVKKGQPFEVVIEVGKYLKHPNENAHFIEWLELYSGETFLARVDFVPRLTEPKVTLTVAVEHAHPLIARTRCNLHGLWQSMDYPLSVV
ncbi:MAG: class II SORL domain-containing protein [Candidatus Aminicenantes bacterium]|nr:class II SORL domain-containing protein [Candidatus Aminicenantes bacterium]